MGKVSNETRLIISLFEERAEKKKDAYTKSYFGHNQENWARGVIKGLNEAEVILADIVSELEVPAKK